MTRFLAAACCAAAIPAAGAQVLRTGIDVVSFGVTVTDRRGRFVTGLSRDDFAVIENGKPQTIRYFLAGDAADPAAPPLHLGLLFDTSGSMEEDIGFARSSAIKFLNACRSAVDVTLVDFDTEVRVARYGPNDFPRLIERIRMRKPEGYTALYDALGVYLDGAAGQEGEKILIIYTDGGDTRSVMGFGDTLTLLKISDVTVYAIGYLEHQRSSARVEQTMKLQQIAGATGGQALFPSTIKDLDRMYATILEEMAARYRIGYVSTDQAADGAWREVEIKLLRKDLRGAKVRTRPGYFAPYRQ